MSDSDNDGEDEEMYGNQVNSDEEEEQKKKKKVDSNIKVNLYPLSIITFRKMPLKALT